MYQIRKTVGANIVTQNYKNLEQALGAIALYAERYKEHVNILLLGSKHREVWVELEEPAAKQAAEQAAEPAQEKPKRGRPKKAA